MSERQAAKVFLRFLLNRLEEEGKQEFYGSIDSVVETMHDDPMFIDDLISFVDEYLTDYAENYGL